MASAIRRVTVQRGIDPRHFAAVASGGAGPVHIARVAQDFEIPRILIPRSAGVMSAIGLITSDIMMDLVRSRIMGLSDADPAAVSEVFAEIESEGFDALAEDDLPRSAITARRSIEVRYLHQAYGINLPLGSDPITRSRLDQLEEEFFVAYQSQYGIDFRGPTEIVNLRVRLVADVRKVSIIPEPAGSGRAEDALVGTRPAYFAENGAFTDTPIYDRERLTPGSAAVGPAVIEERNCTVIVPPGHRFAVDAFGTLELRRPESLPVPARP
jgi:N-methylhydantoinase A